MIRGWILTVGFHGEIEEVDKYFCWTKRPGIVAGRPRFTLHVSPNYRETTSSHDKSPCLDVLLHNTGETLSTSNMTLLIFRSTNTNHTLSALLIDQLLAGASRNISCLLIQYLEYWRVNDKIFNPNKVFFSRENKFGQKSIIRGINKKY